MWFLARGAVIPGVRLPKADNMSALRAGAALVWGQLRAEFNAKAQSRKAAKRGDGINRWSALVGADPMSGDEWR